MLYNLRMNHSAILESLLVSSHHLTRLAARSTGSTTPSAVWRTLSILETDGPLRIGELAAASRITQPGMTKIVQGLVEDELVYRIADVADSRAWLIAVTASGSAALANWRATLATSLEPLLGEVSTDEWVALERAARILQRGTAVEAQVA
jgi:DNA-binding MarR family transcriptional regulator